MSAHDEAHQSWLKRRRCEAVEEFWMDLYTGGLKLIRYTIFGVVISGLVGVGVCVLWWLLA